MKVHKKWDPLLFLALPLLAYSLVVFLPIFFSVFYSFMSWTGISRMRFIGLDNFKRMFSDNVLFTVLMNSLRFTIAGTILQIGGGLVLAILVLQLKRGQNLTRVLLFTPVVISSMAMSQTFRQLLSINPDGVLNSVLGFIGLAHLKVAFLADMNLTLWVVAAVDSYRFCGLYLVIFYAAFIAIDTEIIEAATIDGAKGWQLYTYIRLPIIRGIIVSSTILVVTGTLKAFDTPFILTNGGPGSSSELLALYMYKTAFNSMEFGYASALSLLVVFLCVSSFTIINKLTKQYD